MFIKIEKKPAEEQSQAGHTNHSIYYLEKTYTKVRLFSEYANIFIQKLIGYVIFNYSTIYTIHNT